MLVDSWCQLRIYLFCGSYFCIYLSLSTAFFSNFSLPFVSFLIMLQLQLYIPVFYDHKPRTRQMIILHSCTNRPLFLITNTSMSLKFTLYSVSSMLKSDLVYILCFWLLCEDLQKIYSLDILPILATILPSFQFV